MITINPKTLSLHTHIRVIALNAEGQSHSLLIRSDIIAKRF